MFLVLGMPALIEMSSVEENVALCKKLGLSFIELSMNMPYSGPERLSADRLRRISEDESIYFTMHMPEETDLASFHTAIRKGYLQLCMETMEWAAQAGVRLLNFHLNSGVYYTLPDHRVWIYERYHEEFTANLLESFGFLADAGKRNGVKVSIENYCNFHYPFIASAVDSLAGMDGLYLTWDVGHDAMAGFKETEVLMRNSKKVTHMHLHDYDGKSDHQAPIRGGVNVAGMLRFARERDISVLVEIKTAEALVHTMSYIGHILPQEKR